MSFELYQKPKYRFREGGFNMRKWVSNSDKLIEMTEKQECKLPSTVKTDGKLDQKLKYRFREGGFNMRKWVSNSEKLIEMIEKQECKLPSTVKTDGKLDTGKEKVTEDDENYSKVVLNNNAVCNESEIKVIGSIWNRESDILKFDFSVITTNIGNASLTKRVLLSARFFDPLGLLSPIIPPLKLIFQKACCQIGWNDPQ